MIRRAEDRDIPRVLELLCQVNRLHHEGRPDLFRLATKYGEEDLKAIFRDDSRPVYVWENDQGVQGYAMCLVQEKKGDRMLEDMKTLYVDDLCVDERSRGQGVGRALYDHVLSRARAMGCHNVTLNVWACNPGAMAFYEKCGMKCQKTGMEVLL